MSGEEGRPVAPGREEVPPDEGGQLDELPAASWSRAGYGRRDAHFASSRVRGEERLLDVRPVVAAGEDAHPRVASAATASPSSAPSCSVTTTFSGSSGQGTRPRRARRAPRRACARADPVTRAVLDAEDVGTRDRVLDEARHGAAPRLARGESVTRSAKPAISSRRCVAPEDGCAVARGPGDEGSHGAWPPRDRGRASPRPRAGRPVRRGARGRSRGASASRGRGAPPGGRRRLRPDVECASRAATGPRRRPWSRRRRRGSRGRRS